MLLLTDSSFSVRGRSDISDATIPSRAGPTKQVWGFTLLELLMVISLVALLCGMVVAVGHRAHESGSVARTKTELAALAVALEEYRQICGDYPQTDNPARLLQSLIGRLGSRNEVIAIRNLIEMSRFTTAESLDPFVNHSTVLVDPWGRPYRFVYKTQSPWTNAGYVLYSAGADGRDSSTLLAGGLVDSAPTENVDNLYANR